jgi:hypothetical protein
MKYWDEIGQRCGEDGTCCGAVMGCGAMDKPSLIKRAGWLLLGRCTHCGSGKVDWARHSSVDVCPRCDLYRS